MALQRLTRSHSRLRLRLDGRFRRPATLYRAESMIAKESAMAARRSSHLETFDDYVLCVDQLQRSISCHRAGVRSLGFRMQGYGVLAFLAMLLAFSVYSTIVLATQREFLGLLFTLPLALMSTVFVTVFFDIFVGQWIPGRWKLEYSTGHPLLVRSFILRRTLRIPISPTVRRKRVRYGDRISYIEVKAADGRPVPFGPLFGTTKAYQFHSDLGQAIQAIESRAPH